MATKKQVKPVKKVKKTTNKKVQGEYVTLDMFLELVLSVELLVRAVHKDHEDNEKKLITIVNKHNELAREFISFRKYVRNS